MYRVSKKNMPYRAEATSTISPLAVRGKRARKNRKGTRGDRTRFSMATKATRRAAPVAKKPRVVARPSHCDWLRVGHRRRRLCRRWP